MHVASSFHCPTLAGKAYVLASILPAHMKDLILGPRLGLTLEEMVDFRFASFSLAKGKINEKIKEDYLSLQREIPGPYI